MTGAEVVLRGRRGGFIGTCSAHRHDVRSGLSKCHRNRLAQAGVCAGHQHNAKTASFNDWAAIIYAAGQFYQSVTRENLEIYDRVGGGDGFASGLAYGFLEGKGPQAAVEYGAAHGALAMTTPGDTSMVNVEEVEAIMKGKGARVIR